MKSSKSSDSTRPPQSPEESLSDFGVRLMEAEDRRFARRNLTIVAVIAAAMVSVFAVLDYFAYPEQRELFAYLRWTCVTIMVCSLFLVRSRIGKRYHKFFTVSIPLVPAFLVSMTIFVTRDPASPYYAALSLCLVAIGFLFRWRTRSVVGISGAVFLFYLIACAPAIKHGLNAQVWAGLFSNLVFLMATGAVVVAGSHVHHRMRLEEFRRRERLRRQKMTLRQGALDLQRTLDELRETEGQLIQSGKMASLGQLSAGVIHEIGNPLNHSNQALFLLRRRLRQFPDDDIIREAVEDIQDSVDRMKEIVSELREFSHKRSEVLTEFSLRDSAEVAVRMLGKEIDDHEVGIDLRIDPSLQVLGVKNQVAQVLINLVHNAIQAMSKVDTGRRNLITISASEEEGRVSLRVLDNGPGIPEEIMARIFDPFFTTKEAGEGTGLGLSICFRILEAHRGGIQARSDGSSFSEFVVCLPSAKSAPEQTDFELPEEPANPTSAPVESEPHPDVRIPHHAPAGPPARTVLKAKHDEKAIS